MYLVVNLEKAALSMRSVPGGNRGLNPLLATLKLMKSNIFRGQGGEFGVFTSCVLLLLKEVFIYMYINLFARFFLWTIYSASNIRQNRHVPALQKCLVSLCYTLLLLRTIDSKNH